MTTRGATLVAQQKRAASGTLSASGGQHTLSHDYGGNRPNTFSKASGISPGPFGPPGADLLFPDQRFWLIYKVLGEM